MARTKPKPKPPHARRVYIAALGDRQVRMRAMSGRELVAFGRGKIKRADVIEVVAGAVLFPMEDLGVPDALDADYADLVALLDAWGDAMKEDALPNSKGESSP